MRIRAHMKPLLAGYKLKIATVGLDFDQKGLVKLNIGDGEELGWLRALWSG